MISLTLTSVCLRGKDVKPHLLDPSFVFEPPALLEPFDVDINLLQACEGPASDLVPVVDDGSPVQRSRCPDMRPFLRDRPQSGHSTTRLAVVWWVTCLVSPRKQKKRKEGERAHGQWGRQLRVVGSTLVPGLAGGSSVAWTVCGPLGSPRESQCRSSRLQTCRV